MIGPAQAAPGKDGSYRVLGAGASSCGTWTQDRAHNDFDDVEWVLGYLSGFNGWGQGTPDASEGIDNNGVIAWVDNYCLEHPLNNIGDASAALIFTLYLHKSDDQISK